MREILFRGKRVDNGEWVQGSLFAEGKRIEIVRGTCNNIGIEGVDVLPETVGQYTGLTDNTKWEQLTKEEQSDWLKNHTVEEWNGKKIFEGGYTRTRKSLFCC